MFMVSVQQYSVHLMGVILFAVSHLDNDIGTNTLTMDVAMMCCACASEETGYLLCKEVFQTISLEQDPVVGVLKKILYPC